MTAINENQRLKILDSYRILDTAAEEAFDTLTEVAAAICEAPISLVSLVDDQRQWFKSKVGLDADETPRSQAFCAHAIHNSEIMVVEDALQDARFRSNPLVTGNPHIRFYAGAPLTVSNGFALGTLCVIDRQPRSLKPFQLKALAALRNAVVAQLELRRAAQDFKALESLLRVCAWCRSVDPVHTGLTGNHGKWVPMEDYLSSRHLVSHAICPECFRTQQDDL